MKDDSQKDKPMPKIKNRHRSCPLTWMFALLLLGHTLPVLAQEEASAQEPSPEQTSAAPATTVGDQKVPTDHLKVNLRHMTPDELRIELDAWLDLLRNQIRTVGEAEILMKNLPEGESAEELTNRVVELRETEKSLLNRVNVVISALEKKGGDVAADRTFVTSVSGLGETTDARSFWAEALATVKSWIYSDEGGIRLASKLGLALLILLAFWIVSRFAGRAVGRVLSTHRKTSQLLVNFAERTTGGLVFFIGVLMALGSLGVQIGPLMAALGAGGFILGFALQETLGNFASGLMIMIYQPFDVDDFVTVAGESGKVKEMSLVSTTLTTPDNKLLIIPNKKAWGDTITNFTGQDIRRVDLVFGIGYGDDLRRAMHLLKELTAAHPLVLEEPETSVHVKELADSSVNLFCRPWVKTADYWTVYSDLMQQTKERFDAESISFPFPQREVHIQSDVHPA